MELCEKKNRHWPKPEPVKERKGRYVFKTNAKNFETPTPRL
jgi:hypothetical protein